MKLCSRCITGRETDYSVETGGKGKDEDKKIKENKIQKYSDGAGEKPHRGSRLRNKQRREVNWKSRKQYYRRKDTQR